MLEGLQYSVNIIGYHVEYRESGDSTWLETTVDVTSYRHSFNLTGLNAYTTYQLRAAVLVQEFMGTENITYSDALPATTFEGGVCQMGTELLLLCNYVCANVLGIEGLASYVDSDVL